MKSTVIPVYLVYGTPLSLVLVTLCLIHFFLILIITTSRRFLPIAASIYAQWPAYTCHVIISVQDFLAWMLRGIDLVFYILLPLFHPFSVLLYFYIFMLLLYFNIVRSGHECWR